MMNLPAPSRKTVDGTLPVAETAPRGTGNMVIVEFAQFR